ncbi:Receptor-type tyrosine-protein phosphatase T [Holothuria leucospilota]|uniref:protein-tyrosine-phosphatase n=1 Tax=Holothuria leucospilota TaxID=206669 RepID=A0A9Q1HBE1_HOLLE|nr:Receptor-type tyrosine-protein phosphatase T [Holothuria leucospilota]
MNFILTISHKMCPYNLHGLAHGKNVFGRNGEYKCNESGDANDDGCRGAIICHPHPFGCSCPAGYTGVSCDEDCPDGLYGANCNQHCSCPGGTCAKDTGLCPVIEGEATDPPDVAVRLQYNDRDVLVFSEVSSTSMIVTWPAWRQGIDVGDGPVTSYIIRFRKRELGSVFTSINKDLTLTHTFENFEEDTIYEFRVAIVGPNNVTGPPSTIQYQRTLCPEIPTPSIVETSRTSRTVTYNIQIPLLEQLTCSRRRYRISLQKMQQFGEWKEEQEIHNSDQTITVQDLLPCTSYSFRIVVSSDSSLWTEIASETTQVTTGEEAPGAVRNLAIGSSTAGALSITWDEPDRVNNPCDVSRYILSYKLVGHKACNQDETGEHAINKHIKITETDLDNLEDYADYDISVTAVSLSNLQGMRTTQRGRTESGEPSGGVLVQSYGITANSIRFSWSGLTCRDYNGPHFSYQLRLFERTNDNDPTYHLAYEVSTSGNSILIPNLKSCGNYQLRVTPENDFHTGQASSSNIIQTRSADLGPVENVSVRQTSYGLSVTWQPPATTSNICPVNYYTLQYTVHRYMSCPSNTLNGEQQVIRIPISSTYQQDLTELTPNTRYRIQVAANSGSFSTPKYGTTVKQVPSMAPVVSTDDSESSPRRLVFTWRPIDCEHMNGNFQYYNITSNGKADEVTIDDESTDRYTLTGLTPCTTYDFKIQVVNNVGNGPFGSMVVKTRVERPGSNFLLKLRATGAETISAEWKRPHGHPCTIRSQTIFIEMLDRGERCLEDLDRSKSYPLSSGIRSYVFEDLSPNSLYRISLRAENSAGFGDMSSEEERTNESRPTLPPDEVEVRRTSSTHIKFAWNKPPCGSHNGDIIRYHCRLRKKGEIINHTSSSKRVEFFNLVPFTNYSFEVSAVTAVGEGPYSVPLWIKTNESYPPQLPQPQAIFSNTSAIQIKWKIPDPPHGIILGYDIFVQLNESRNGNFSSTQGLNSSEASNSSTTFITDLRANTLYSVQVRAKTRVGPGNWSEPLIQYTAEGKPGPPSNVNITERTFTTLKVEWDEPLTANGQITKYKIRIRTIEKSYIDEFRPEKFTSTNHHETKKHNVHEIDSLEPSTVYEIEISAYTSAGKGEIVILRERTKLNTDLEPVKEMPTTAERKDTAAIITIPALTQTYATGYFVRVKHSGNARRDTGYLPGYEKNPNDYITAEVDKSDHEIAFTVGDNMTYGRYHNAPLHEDGEYEVFVAPFTAANGEIFVSDWSDPVKIPASRQGSPALLIILIILFFLAIVIVALIVLYKRRQQTKQNKEYSARNVRERTERPEIVMVPNESQEEIEMKTSSLKNSATTNAKKPPVAARSRKSDKVIKIADLASYVKRKKTSETENFFQEYETLPDSFQYPWDVAAKPENKKKNRYGNIIPYNSSRVVLEIYNNDPHSDYINASYIDGYKYPTKYIASHGPNTASVKDFWRMVWQEDVGKIVMLTNLVEMDKKKCEKYWPDDALKYANVIVTLKEENKDTSYTVRTFELSLVDKDETKLVRQFHFTAWPDMKVPEFAGPILDLLQIVRNEESHQAGPMVVHCSAGVGRTGTFIALDAMLDMAAAEDRINVYQFVCQMRQNRVKMVQIPEQYQFIFDALVEYFVIGNTSIQVDDFRSDLGRLNEINIGSGKSYLEEQYQTLELTSIVPPETKFKGGRSSENKRKNRFRNRIPVDTYRPYLMTDVGDLGNNYINASFLSGYRKKDMFLGTQMPLENTVIDFWRMVWDYNSHVIVMLNDIDSQNMAKYWHETGSFTCGPFTIQLLSCEDITGIRCRNLEITNSSQSFENPRLIKHLQCLNWPNSVTTPDDPKTLLHAVNMLSQWDAESDAGPITVHCIDGVGRTGLFCALVSAVDQINTERKVDIFQLVNKLRSSRPNMVDNFEQYRCIFDTTLRHLEDYDQVYENVGR